MKAPVGERAVERNVDNFVAVKAPDFNTFQ
jgi:hypothetical protein